MHRDVYDTICLQDVRWFCSFEDWGFTLTLSVQAVKMPPKIFAWTRRLETHAHPHGWRQTGSSQGVSQPEPRHASRASTNRRFASQFFRAGLLTRLFHRFFPLYYLSAVCACGRPKAEHLGNLKNACPVRPRDPPPAHLVPSADGPFSSHDVSPRCLLSAPALQDGAMSKRHEGRAAGSRKRGQEGIVGPGVG